jgi:hypothetical protein
MKWWDYKLAGNELMQERGGLTRSRASKQRGDQAGRPDEGNKEHEAAIGGRWSCSSWRCRKYYSDKYKWRWRRSRGAGK